jgi:hypothetical protein
MSILDRMLDRKSPESTPTSSTPVSEAPSPTHARFAGMIETVLEGIPTNNKMKGMVKMALPHLVQDLNKMPEAQLKEGLKFLREKLSQVAGE